MGFKMNKLPDYLLYSATVEYLDGRRVKSHVVFGKIVNFKWAINA